MDGGVEGLDPAIKNLRVPRCLTDVDDVDPCLPEPPGGSAGGQNLPSQSGEGGPQGLDALLVPDTDEGTWRRHD